MVASHTGAAVKSLKAMEEFHASLGVFSGTLEDTIQSIRRDSSAIIEKMESSCDDYADRVRQLQEAISDDSSEDVSSELLQVLESAEQKLARMQQLLRQARCVFDELNEIISEQGRESADELFFSYIFVREKINLLRQFEQSVQDFNSVRLFEGKRRAESIDPEDDVIRIPLPNGLTWIRLEQIALSEELAQVQPPEQFKKISYEEMRDGAERFMSQVIPQLQRSGAELTSEWFAARDRESGLPYEKGLQRVFDAFLGESSPVYLCKRSGDSLYSVINGRHRIKIAQTLGWQAVPAKTKEVQRA